jgi:hypothetical protein
MTEKNTAGKPNNLNQPKRVPITSFKGKKPTTENDDGPSQKSSRGDWIRTSDLLNPILGCVRPGSSLRLCVFARDGDWGHSFGDGPQANRRVIATRGNGTLMRGEGNCRYGGAMTLQDRYLFACDYIP